MLYSVFFAVFIIAFLAGVYFRSFAGNEILSEPNKKASIAIVEKYTENVFCKYKNVLGDFSSKSLKEWKEDNYFQRFIKLSSAVLKTIPAFKISLYSNNNEEIFS